MADNRPIGVFDSGIGGLTVLREIIKTLPGESTVYFGDDGRAPYGSKSHDTIIRYSLQDMLFLQEKDVKMIVIACNTASTHAYEMLSKHSKVPVIEVVTPGAECAVRATMTGRIGIIATNATVSSGAYETAVKDKAGELLSRGENKKAMKSLSVIQQACPLFVSLAEEGWWDDEIAYLTARRYLKDVKDFGVDTLVLACTHYPLLAKTIAKVMGDKVTLINSGVAVASKVAQIISENGMASDGMNVTREFYTSDDAERFENVAAPFLGSGLPRGTVKHTVDRYDISEFL
ncbi:MAG: glutamate racemase [Clostridiales bacterium]|nr:glutamate racemase [Clostridiales bacterium]